MVERALVVVGLWSPIPKEYSWFCYVGNNKSRQVRESTHSLSNVACAVYQSQTGREIVTLAEFFADGVKHGFALWGKRPRMRTTLRATVSMTPRIFSLFRRRYMNWATSRLSTVIVASPDGVMIRFDWIAHRVLTSMQKFHKYGNL